MGPVISIVSLLLIPCFYLIDTPFIYSFILLNLFVLLKKYLEEIYNLNFLSDLFILISLSLLSFIYLDRFHIFLLLTLVNSGTILINQLYIKSYESIRKRILSEAKVKVLKNEKIKLKNINDLTKEDLVFYQKGDLVITNHEEIAIYEIAPENLLLHTSYKNKFDLPNSSKNFFEEFSKGSELNKIKNRAKTINKINLIVALAIFITLNFKLRSDEVALKFSVYYLIISQCGFLVKNYILSIYYAYLTCFNHYILIHDSEVFKKFLKVDSILIDKSHILLKEKFYIKNTDQELIDLVGSLEKNLSNYISTLIKSYQKREINYKKQVSKKYDFGYKIEADSEEYLIGSEELFNNLKIDLPFKKAKHTIIYVYDLKNKNYLGNINIYSRLDQNTKRAINNLKKNFQDIIILSGDNFDFVKSLAETLHVERYLANQSRKDKLEYIKLSQKDGSNILFVGNLYDDKVLFKEAFLSVALEFNKKYDSIDISLIDKDLNKLIYLKKVSERLKNINSFNRKITIGLKLLMIFLLFTNSFNIYLGFLINYLLIIISIYFIRKV